MSYFDALDQGGSNLGTDLSYLAGKGVDGIRIFPNWWAVTLNSTTHYPNTPYSYDTDTLCDASGNLRATALSKLLGVLDDAKDAGLLVDISMAAETVSGLTLAEYGGAASNGIVRLAQQNGTVTIVNTRWFARIGARGRFTIAGIAPGVYTLSAEAEGNNGAASERQFASLPLSVDNGMPPVSVMLRRPAHFKGRVDGAPLQVIANLSLMAQPVGNSFHGHRSARLAPDGTFDLAVPPGQWALTLIGLPRLAAVDEVAGGTQGVVDAGTTDVADIRLDVDTFGAGISGTVLANGHASNPTVLVASERFLSHPDAIAGIVVARARAGAFTIDHLNPGSYWVVAVDLADERALYDPDVRRALLANATTVNLRPGQTSAVALSLSIR